MAPAKPYNEPVPETITEQLKLESQLLLEHLRSNHVGSYAWHGGWNAHGGGHGGHCGHADHGVMGLSGGRRLG